MKARKSYRSKLSKALNWPLHQIRSYWRGGWWHKTVVSTVAVVLLCVGGMYGIARWYIWTQRNQPYTLGVSFIPAYAESLGLNAQQTMDALINDAGVRNFRLVSYWDQLEPAPGQYDFSLLDWQFQKAEASHSKITLSLGLRQPRWPECHMPAWAASEPYGTWNPQLQSYIRAIVERYKDSPALGSYQVENEYFLKGFGNCQTIPGAMDRQRLVDEFNLVKQLDPHHTAIINRSNNALGWPIGQPQPDEFGISIYKRVWDAGVTHRYIEYPFPAWYYAFVAGWQKIFTGKDMIIHEMQAESWGPHGQQLQNVPVAEANKSLNAERLRGRVAFAKGTGMHETYLWGAEYWYFRQQVQHDPSLWNTARQLFAEQRGNAPLLSILKYGTLQGSGWGLTVNQDGSGVKTWPRAEDPSTKELSLNKITYKPGTFNILTLQQMLADYGDIQTLGKASNLTLQKYGPIETLIYHGHESKDIAHGANDADGQAIIDTINTTILVVVN